MYPEDAKAAGANRPLAPNTLTRIAAGVERFVIEADEPYIVSYYGPKNGKNFRGQALTAPLPTQTTERRFALVNPLISPITLTGPSSYHLMYHHMPPLTPASRGATPILTTITCQTPSQPPPVNSPGGPLTPPPP